jgi:hypothetical protein
MLDEFPVFLSRNPTQWGYFHVEDMYSSNIENHTYANDVVCGNTSYDGTGRYHYNTVLAYSTTRITALQNESEYQESEWEYPDDA